MNPTPTLPTLLICAACLLVSCGDTEPQPDLRRQTLEALGSGVIMPMFRDFETSAASLEGASSVFCDQPDEAGLEGARAAWDEARGAWKRLEVFNFGPVTELPERFGPKLDFWPVRVDTVESTLSSDIEMTPESLAMLGTASRGLPVVEYLLYGELALEAMRDDPRRCAYLVAASGDVARTATALRASWDPTAGDFLGELTRAGEGSLAFETLVGAVGEIINRMGFLCENMRRDKLNRPLGQDAGGVAQPSLVESRFSARSTRDMLDNLAGIEALYYGRYKGEQVMGWSGYLAERNIDLDPAFDSAMGSAVAALEGINGPLGEAISNNPGSVEAVLEPLRQLQRILQTDLITAVGADVTFNDADGD